MVWVVGKVRMELLVRHNSLKSMSEQDVQYQLSFHSNESRKKRMDTSSEKKREGRVRLVYQKRVSFRPCSGFWVLASRAVFSVKLNCFRDPI